MRTKLLFHKFGERPEMKSVVVNTGCPLFTNDHEKVPEVRELLDTGWDLVGHIDGWEDVN